MSPVVFFPKPKQPGGVRLCVDMREANKDISRERHLLPILEVIHDLNHATVFSKLDLNQGYHYHTLPHSLLILAYSGTSVLFLALTLLRPLVTFQMLITLVIMS